MDASRTPPTSIPEYIAGFPPFSGDPQLEKALARHAGPKGNLGFPLDRPVPDDPIERLVAARAQQLAAKTSARRRKPGRRARPGASRETSGFASRPRRGGVNP